MSDDVFFYYQGFLMRGFKVDESTEFGQEMRLRHEAWLLKPQRGGLPPKKRKKEIWTVERALFGPWPELLVIDEADQYFRPDDPRKYRAFLRSSLPRHLREKYFGAE